MDLTKLQNGSRPMSTIVNTVEYYAYLGPMTNPGEHASLFDGLPADIPALCQVVQGLLLHISWAERCGIML